MNLLKIYTALLVCLLMISCSKDDENKAVNTVKINGQSFSINAASILGVSIENSGHSAITLLSGSETQGQTLTIDVESFTKETIEGTYSYPLIEGDKALDDWLTNYMVYNNSDMTSNNLESGTVTVIHNGDTNYTIEMDLTMVDGVTFKGTYTDNFTVMFMNN